jgi:hypothetical protein
MSWWWLSPMVSCGMWHCVVLSEFRDISDVSTASWECASHSTAFFFFWGGGGWETPTTALAWFGPGLLLYIPKSRIHIFNNLQNSTCCDENSEIAFEKSFTNLFPCMIDMSECMYKVSRRVLWMWLNSPPPPPTTPGPLKPITSQNEKFYFFRYLTII